MADRLGRDRPGASRRGDVRLRAGGCGVAAAFRAGLVERGLTYAAGILSTQHVYPTDVSLEPPSRRTRGRPATNPVPSVESRSAADFIAALPEKSFQRVSWRAGTKGAMRGDFAAVRVRVWPTDRLCARVATCRGPRSGWSVSGAPMSANST